MIIDTTQTINELHEHDHSVYYFRASIDEVYKLDLSKLVISVNDLYYKDHACVDN